MSFVFKKLFQQCPNNGFTSKTVKILSLLQIFVSMIGWEYCSHFFYLIHISRPLKFCNSVLNHVQNSNVTIILG